MFLATGLASQVLGHVNGADNAPPHHRLLEDRWFGDENRKKVVKAMLLAGDQALQGKWISAEPPVFACVWSSGTTATLVWVAVFDGATDKAPRTTVVPVATAGKALDQGKLSIDPLASSTLLPIALDTADCRERWLSPTEAAAAAATPSLPLGPDGRPPLPWHLVNIWWTGFPLTTDFDCLDIDITVAGDLPEGLHLCVLLFDSFQPVNASRGCVS
jgi:hypothetical protein